MQEYKIEGESITTEQVKRNLRQWLQGLEQMPENVLLIPPDYTRSYSCAGLIVRQLYQILPAETRVDVMPALGTHSPVTKKERLAMFGPEIPAENYLVHDWREDVVEIGCVPGEYVAEISDGILDFPIPVNVNERIVSGKYDLILSIGQVVPHEVVGMANYSKNIFVGCGGSEMINKTHYLGAAYGMERILGRDKTPVRKVFDYAEEHFLQDIPLQYILTVTTKVGDEPCLHGLFMGRSREIFEAAVDLSQSKNITKLEQSPDKVVVYLSPEEFKSTWLGNKAVYRTRMAISDGGELIILAPGLKRFGEDDNINELIKKYGYRGRKEIIRLVEEEEKADLRENLSAAAHLIHGSSEGRFNICYCPGNLDQEEIEKVNYSYRSLEEVKYDPAQLAEGYNRIGQEEIYYISNPALGLWVQDENSN